MCSNVSPRSDDHIALSKTYMLHDEVYKAEHDYTVNWDDMSTTDEAARYIQDLKKGLTPEQQEWLNHDCGPHPLEEGFDPEVWAIRIEIVRRAGVAGRPEFSVSYDDVQKTAG